MPSGVGHARRSRRRSRRRWTRTRTAARRTARAASSMLIVPITLTSASNDGLARPTRARRSAPRGGRRPRASRCSSSDATSVARRGCPPRPASRPARWRRLEVRLAAGREVVEHDHLVAAVEQSVDQIRADEAGSAGDKSLQDLGLLLTPQRCIRIGNSLICRQRLLLPSPDVSASGATILEAMQ